MPKIESKCALGKEVILLVLGGILSLFGAVVTTCINNSHEERIQNSRNAFSFLQEYNKNYLRVINCKKEIIDTVKILGRNLNIKVNSLETSDALTNYYKNIDKCNSDLLKMKLISTAVGLNTSGIDCFLDKLSALNNKIITTREIMAYGNSKINFHAELGYELQAFPNSWGKCLKEINDEFVKFSKNFLINKKV